MHAIPFQAFFYLSLKSDEDFPFQIGDVLSVSPRRSKRNSADTATVLVIFVAAISAIVHRQLSLFFISFS